MKFLKFLLVFAVAVLMVVYFHGYLLGAALTPLLEKVMTDAFDMRVNVEGLYVRAWPPHVHADKIECLNPPGFRRRDHYTGTGIDLDLDLTYLKNKFIRIRKAHFKGVVFAIESYTTPQGTETNVWHWYHHMGLDEDDPPLPATPHPAPPPDNAGEDHWRVRIDFLDLDRGEVIFDDRRTEPEFQWVFKDLTGYWTGFDFLSDYVSPVFTETIKLEGTFGKHPPAHFKGEGRCQFADGDNFDVKTEITDGSVMEYNFLMDGLPGEVRDGRFDLKSKLRCVESDLDSDHQLILKNLKFAAPSVTQKLMKYPLSGVLMLLETQKTVELDMRVDGYIGDPKFRVASAFTQALQKGLTDKTLMTLKGVGKGTLIVATETPKQMKNGLVKIASLLTDPFFSKADGTQPDEGETSGG